MASLQASSSPTKHTTPQEAMLDPAMTNLTTPQRDNHPPRTHTSVDYFDSIGRLQERSEQRQKEFHIPHTILRIILDLMPTSLHHEELQTAEQLANSLKHKRDQLKSSLPGRLESPNRKRVSPTLHKF